MPARRTLLPKVAAIGSVGARLRSFTHPAEAVWILLVIVIPLSAGQPRAAPFMTNLLSLPGLTELALVLASGLSVVWIARKSPMQLVRRLRSPWILPLAAYYGLGLLSSAFSQFPLYALAYITEAIIGLLLSIVVFGGLLEHSHRSKLDPLYFVAGLFCAQAVAAWIFDPASAWIVDARGSVRLAGAVLHPNQLGFWAALLGLGSVAYGSAATTARMRVLPVIMLGLAIPVLIATRSRTDLLGFAAGTIVILILGRRWTWIAVGIAGILVGVAAIPRLALRAFAYVNRGLQAPVLAGRLAIWKYILRHSVSSWKSVLLGEGIGTSSRVLRRAVARWPFPSHAHNLMVEALNNVGIPGVGLVLASLASTGFRIAALVRRNRSGLAADAGQLAALFILVLTTSLVESSFAGRANSYGFAYWALAAACYAQPDPGVRPREHEEGGVET